MALTVWMERWEMECCGTPFEVGSRVTWSLEPAGQRAHFLAQLLDSRSAPIITHFEGRHGPEHPGRPARTATEGTVNKIGAVYARYAYQPSVSTEASTPVAGSGQLEERTEAVRWEVKSKDDRAFMGYVIELAA